MITSRFRMPPDIMAVKECLDGCDGQVFLNDDIAKQDIIIDSLDVYLNLMEHNELRFRTMIYPIPNKLHKHSSALL